MKRYLPLPNHNKLLTQIAETITGIYPMDVDPLSVNYSQRPGIKHLNDIMGKYIDDNDNFSKPCTDLLAILKNSFDNPINNTSSPMDRCFSAELILDKYENDEFLRIKKIVFALSFVGPYFVINGIDETGIKEKNEPKVYKAINIITTSPYKEFEKDFNTLYTIISEQFPGYQFLSHRFTSLFVKGLVTNFSYPAECTIYNALFNNTLDDYQKGVFRGDISFGIEPNNISVSLKPLK